MKKILFLIMFMLGAISTYAEVLTDIEFKVPAGFKVDTISATTFVIEKDSAFGILDFISIPNLDKDKVNAAHDSIFVKVGNMKPIQTGLKGNADVINKYYDEAKQKYVKVYRHHHGDGIAYLFAVNDVDDFEWSDSIDDSYHKGLRWYMWVLIIIPALIFLFSTFVMADSFLKNWPKFIVSALVCIILFVVVGLLTSWGIASVASSILLVFGLLIGIPSRFGYTIIPI